MTDSHRLPCGTSSSRGVAPGHRPALPTLTSHASFRAAVWRALVACLLLWHSESSIGQQETVTLAWDPNPESDIAGYRIYYGLQPGIHPVRLDVGNVTTNTVEGLTNGVTYYFVVTAVNTSELESLPSIEVSYTVPQPASVTGQFVFYNNSAWDRNDPSVNAFDDSAIASDKLALLPGQQACFLHYTSYSRGLNGIMIDIQHLAGTPTVQDFEFRVGNDSRPAQWGSAPAPSAITLRPGAGVGGADRITVVWPDNAIQKQWLQVTVRATDNTGLGTDYLFYFGNAIGETGNCATDTLIDPLDLRLTRNNQRSILDPAPIDFPYDFNRDRFVDPADQLIARRNQTSIFSMLHVLFAPPAAEVAQLATAPPRTTVALAAARASNAMRVAAAVATPHATALAPLPLLSIRRTGAQVVVESPADPSATYRLEFVDRLGDTAWRAVAETPAWAADRGHWVWTVPWEPDERQRFYRIAIPE